MNNLKAQRRRNNYEEPYVGMPLPINSRYNCSPSTCGAVDTCPLAMAYVPFQCWCSTYEPEEALSRGTIFPELDLPFLGGGAC